MKRSIGFSLCLCLLLTCLTGCSGRYQENVWYSQQRQEECLVPELPAPKNRSYVNDRDADIYCFMNSSEFSGYVETIYDYLQSKNFAYFGTRGAMVNTLAGAFTTYEFQPAGESLEDFFVDGVYRFVYSDGSVDADGVMIFYILLIIPCEQTTLEYGFEEAEYNTKICLCVGSETAINNRYVLPETENAE